MVAPECVCMSQLLEPTDTTLFGKGVLVDVIKLQTLTRVAPTCSDKSLLKGGEEQTTERRPCRDGGRVELGPQAGAATFLAARGAQGLEEAGRAPPQCL